MRAICLATLIVCALGFSNAWAAEEASGNILDTRFTVYGGVQFYQTYGNFRSTRAGDSDIDVDLDDIGLSDDAVSPAIGAIINFGDRKFTLRLDYFGYHDNGDETADYTFPFGGINFPVGARLKSNLDLDLYVANLSYNFIRSERASLGVGLGVHAVDLDLGISGTVNVAGVDVPLGTGSSDVLAPLPNVYLNGAYSLADKFLLKVGSGGFAMNYGDWGGALFFADAFLEYWPFKHVGFGAGYRYFRAYIKHDINTKTEKYNIALPGPLFYVTAGF